MPAFLSEMLSQVKAIWARLDAGQRLVIAAVLLSTAVGLGAIVWFAGRPDYRAVYSSMETRELMQAARALDQGSIGYRIEGTSLVVESGDWDAARRALASAGIGSAGGPDGGELSQMTSDRATRMHALARMMERDAERKLLAIRGVIHAHVSHSKPKRSPYRLLDDETQPRANVGLRITPGVSFLAVANAAIHEASAALGMPPEYVTVTNLATMQTHSRDKEAAASLDTSEFLAQQRRRSEELTSRAQSLLDRIYPDKAVVRVTVVLDPDWEMIRERGAPQKQLVKRTVTTKEDTVDPPGFGGDPGAAGAPGGGAVGTAAQSAVHKKESKETEYAADGYRETSSGKLAPDIRKMSVALVIDEKLVEDPQVEQQLRSLVKNAIGWSKDWGAEEDFTVLKTAIPEVAEVSEPALPGVLSLVDRYGATVGQLLAVVLVLLFLRGLLKRNAPAAVPGARAAAPATADAEAAETPENSVRRMRKEIERAIADDPAAISRLLETWLTEQKA